VIAEREENVVQEQAGLGEIEQRLADVQQACTNLASK
jgi:hypothetical protein